MPPAAGLHSSEVTTGVPIYLVSACTSGEEFVAAFRRYLDRSGLFVPIAEPIAVGLRGRFALTLRDGGVMVEGDGEVISSSRTPSLLHGRIGMTIRFAELDDPSKAMLVELEQARLAPKPLAPSVAPRPADVPAEPRPVPPAPAGRIDANNALAECVAIGEVGKLCAPVVKAPAKAGPKFVVPVIPPVASGSKSPATPPAGIAKAPAAPPAPARGSLSTTLNAVAQVTTANLPAGAFSATMPAISIGGLPSSKAAADDESELAEPPVIRGGTKPMPVVTSTHMRAQIMSAVEPPTITPTEMSAVPDPPIIATTRSELPILETEEPTDQTAPPVPQAADEPLPPAEPQLPTIEEPTPSGDWTMTPGVDGSPTISKRIPVPAVPAGDWLISIDAAAPDGWTEPSQVDKPPLVTQTRSVSNAPPPGSVERRKHVVSVEAEPKVQVDPTLIAPPTMMPPPPDPARRLTPTPGMPATTRARSSDPHLGAELLDRSSTATVEGRRRHPLVIVASAVLAAVVGIVLYLVFDPSKPAGDRTRVETDPIATGNAGQRTDAGLIELDAAVAVAPPADAAVAEVADDAEFAADAAVAAVAAVTAVECYVEVVSSPTHAEIVIDKTTVLGTTPAKLPLPCAAEVKLLIRKPKYVSAHRSVVPTAQGAKVRVALVKPTFSVKITSQPPGATVMVNGKSMGVTPTTVRLPGFELSILTLTKDGWATDTQKISPKQNNLTVQSTLKKRGRGGT